MDSDYIIIAIVLMVLFFISRGILALIDKAILKKKDIKIPTIYKNILSVIFALFCFYGLFNYIHP